MDRDLDERLDLAIRAYGEAEAPLGLEARVLRRASARRPVLRWVWIPVGVAACLAFVLWPPKVSVPLPHGHGSLSPGTVVAGTVVVPAAVPTVPLRAVTVRERYRKPTLSVQQKALIDLVDNHPELAAQLAREVPDQLSIQPLTIEPLAISALDQ